MRKQIRNSLAQAIFKRDNFTCQYCGELKNLSIDHIQPITKGGTDKTINLITSCLKCNVKKQNKILDKPPIPKRIKLKGLPNFSIKIKLDEQSHRAFKAYTAKTGQTMQAMVEYWVKEYIVRPGFKKGA
jgi:5-methylcytosine-specific restriction endonuclease McrA